MSDALMFRAHNLAPNAGGLLDQSPRWLEALTILNNEIHVLRDHL